MGVRKLNVELHLRRDDFERSEQKAREVARATATGMVSDADKAESARTELHRRATQQKIADAERGNKAAVAGAAHVVDAEKRVALQAAMSGTAVRKAGTEMSEAMNRARGSTLGLGDSMQGLVSGGAVLTAARQAASMFATSMTEASEYTHRVAADFLDVQKRMQAMSALVGNVNSDKATSEQIRAAMGANVKTAEMIEFRESFLSAASTYVGKGPNAKLDESESETFQVKLAEYGKLHGIPLAAMADFAGKALAQERGPTNAKDMLKKIGKSYATVEAASASPQHLIPGLTALMAGGFSLEEAAPALSQLPEIAPNEEFTHLNRVIQEVRELGMKGKAGQYGIEKGMRPAAQLTALIANLHGRTAGGTDDDVLNKLIAEITPESIAQRTLAGLVKQGPKGGQMWRDILAKTSPTIVEEDIVKGRASDAGRTMHAESQLSGQELLRGKRFADATRMKQLAEAALAKEGDFDLPNPVQDFARNWASSFGGSAPKQQRINERAVEMANLGVPAQYRETLHMGASQVTADNTIRDLLIRQNMILEEQLRLAKSKDQAAARPPKGVPPPIPATPVARPNGARPPG
jgi:hypothetical protein